MASTATCPRNRSAARSSTPLVSCGPRMAGAWSFSAPRDATDLTAGDGRRAVSGMNRLLTAYGFPLILFLMSTASQALDLQGHRGARGLKPENTLPAFAHALTLGVTTLELDCAVTKDGVVVVSHDSTLNPDITRGPDGKWLQGEGPPI